VNYRDAADLSKFVYAATKPINKYSLVLKDGSTAGLFPSYCNEPELLHLVMFATLYPYDYEYAEITGHDRTVVMLQRDAEELFRETVWHMGSVITFDPAGMYEWFWQSDFEELPFKDIFGSKEKMLMVMSCRVGAWARGARTSMLGRRGNVVTIGRAVPEVPWECVENDRMYADVFEGLIEEGKI